MPKAKAKKTASPKPTGLRASMPKSWSVYSQDGIELRAYVNLGFCEGYNVNDLINKYPQFAGYDKKTLYNCVTRLRKQAEEQRKLEKDQSDGCKCHEYY